MGGVRFGAVVTREGMAGRGCWEVEEGGMGGTRRGRMQISGVE